MTRIVIFFIWNKIYLPVTANKCLPYQKFYFMKKTYFNTIVYESIQVIFHFFLGRVIRKLSIWLKKIIKGIKRLDNVQKFLS